MPVGLQHPQALDLDKLRLRALNRHLGEIRAAAQRQGASKLAYYLDAAWGGQVPWVTEESLEPAAYLGAVRQRSRRVALAQLRTGSHWLAEETGRWERLAREQRVCPHCGGGVEDVRHMMFVFPLYAPIRARFPDLFSGADSVHSVLRRDARLLAAFAAECQRVHAAATEEVAAAAGGP
jgi:hypothetical protein